MNALARHLRLRNVVVIAACGKPRTAAQEGDHGPEAVLTGFIVNHAATSCEERRHGHSGKFKRGSEKPGMAVRELRLVRLREGVVRPHPGRFQVRAPEAHVEYLAVFIVVEMLLG